MSSERALYSSDAAGPIPGERWRTFPLVCRMLKLPFGLTPTLATFLLCAASPLVVLAQTAQGGAVNINNALRLVGAKQVDSAVVVLEAIVAAKRPATPRALLELVAIYAQQSKFDDAARVFELARTRGTDLSGVAIRPEVIALRNDKRFALLFPEKASFTKPFVEKVRIIHEWRGESAGDEFGWIARAIGDVDGDRVTDVVVSATQNAPFGATRGLLYVYSGKSGRQLWRNIGENGWLLGLSVEAAGDVDGDGTPDVVAGAPGALHALVYSGRDGRELLRVTGDSTESGFGGAVSGVGDVDHDGHADFAVGAQTANTTGASAGRVMVFSGKTGARLLVLDGERAGDRFGSAVAGTKGTLIAIGAAGAGPARAGRVYGFNGTSKTPLWVSEADSTGSSLGAGFVSIAGDVDGDGNADVFASDFSNSARGPATGRTYVYSGSTGRALLTLTGDVAGEMFGTSASVAGDVDRDGHADLAIGSWQFAGAAWSGGRVTVYSGRTGRELQRFTGRVPAETLGFDAVGVGDVDGDGAVDFLVTSAYSLVNGARSGRTYIVAGTRAPR